MSKKFKLEEKKNRTKQTWRDRMLPARPAVPGCFPGCYKRKLFSQIGLKAN